jgi:NAD(P)-dependent dehydrogenase (short-subunit alcohol dehydrogenase family)
MFELKGRTAVVVGGSQGLGGGVALSLAQQGADIAILFRRASDQQQGGAEKVMSAARAIGREAVAIDVDATSTSDLESASGEILKYFPRIDILVNCIGGYPTPPKPMRTMSERDWDLSIELNLRTTFLCCRAFTSTMIEHGWGRIINISSGSAFRGTENQANYSAAKAGLVALSKSLAREVGPSGITVNVIAPGRIDSPMTDMGLQKNWWGDYPIDMFPMRRIGTISDVAAAASFLASEEAGWITGHTIHVNGGSYMP